MSSRAQTHQSSAEELLPPIDVVDQLGTERLVDLAAGAAALHARAIARLVSLQQGAIGRATLPEYLTVDEAAALLRVTPEWVYRKAAEWTFATKLAPKILRIQRTGLLHWIEQRSRG